MPPLVEKVRALVVEAHGQACAIPLQSIVETLRPLKTEALAGLPPFVLGCARIRGKVVPVVDLGLLMGSGRLEAPQRFVTLRVGNRWVALAVDAADRVIFLEKQSLGELPPLLKSAEAISTLGVCDRELLVVLDAGRMVPSETWEHFESAVHV